jgi:steroid delta-isomerase-like uncharacterized protein
MVALESRAVEANTAIIREYYDALNVFESGTAAMRLAAILAEDFIFHPPNSAQGILGRERHIAWLAWHHGTVSGQHFELDDIVADDARAATRWTLSGINSGEFLGIPASGRSIQVTGQDYYRLQGGTIVAMWRSVDLRELVRQCGGGPA